MTKFQDFVMNHKITWSIISIPTGDWAQKVFPNKSRAEAMESLWEAIVKIVRVDKEDPMAAWDAHNETLTRAEKILNDKNYKKLNYKRTGTNLQIGLPKRRIM